MAMLFKFSLSIFLLMIVGTLNAAANPVCVWLWQTSVAPQSYRAVDPSELKKFEVNSLNIKTHLEKEREKYGSAGMNLVENGTRLAVVGGTEYHVSQLAQYNALVGLQFHGSTTTSVPLPEFINRRMGLGDHSAMQFIGVRSLEINNSEIHPLMYSRFIADRKIPIGIHVGIIFHDLIDHGPGFLELSASPMWLMVTDILKQSHFMFDHTSDVFLAQQIDMHLLSKLGRAIENATGTFQASVLVDMVTALNEVWPFYLKVVERFRLEMERKSSSQRPSQ